MEPTRSTNKIITSTRKNNQGKRSTNVPRRNTEDVEKKEKQRARNEMAKT